MSIKMLFKISKFSHVLPFKNDLNRETCFNARNKKKNVLEIVLEST